MVGLRQSATAANRQACSRLFTVNILRLHIRQLTWIALVAVLALAGVPTLSRALPPAGSGEVMGVCTSQGIKQVSIGEGDFGGAPIQAEHHLDHCPLCALALDGAAPLPARGFASPVPVAGAEAPQPIAQAVHTSFVWLGAQARAPPFAA